MHHLPTTNARVWPRLVAIHTSRDPYPTPKIAPPAIAKIAPGKSTVTPIMSAACGMFQYLISAMCISQLCVKMVNHSPAPDRVFALQETHNKEKAPFQRLLVYPKQHSLQCLAILHISELSDRSTLQVTFEVEKYQGEAALVMVSCITMN